MIISTILILLAAYIALYIVSIFLKDNSIADIFWGFWFMLISWTLFLLPSWPISTPALIILMLVTIWGARLTLHIGSKKFSHSGEDKRYAGWRKQWKYFYTRSFFQVYMLQWLLMCLVAFPIFIALTGPFQNNVFLTLTWWLIALIWLLYEVVADTQLAQFMTTKKKWEICTFWLRKYSRYPQYFGESLFWLGISLIAFQFSIYSFIGWIVITILVRYVSWAAMLERRYEWDINYKKYSEITPIFIPDFKK